LSVSMESYPRENVRAWARAWIWWHCSFLSLGRDLVVRKR
jgi:hypothetical protein